MSQGINLSRKDYFDNKMNLMDNKMNLIDNKMNSVNNMYDELTQVNETQNELYSQLAQTNTQINNRSLLIDDYINYVVDYGKATEDWSIAFNTAMVELKTGSTCGGKLVVSSGRKRLANSIIQTSFVTIEGVGLTSEIWTDVPNLNLIVSEINVESPQVLNLKLTGSGFGTQPANSTTSQDVANAGSGIIWRGAKKGIIAKCDINNHGGDGSSQTKNGVAGIWLTYGCEDCIVEDNHVYNCRNGINEDNFFYRDAKNNTIKNNYVYNCRFGIATETDYGTGCKILGNTVKNCAYGAVDVNRSSYVLVQGNIFEGNGLTGIADTFAATVTVYGNVFIRQQFVRVENNIFRDSHGYAVKIAQNNYFSSITNNTIINCINRGAILVQGIRYYKIMGNQIYTCTGTAIRGTAMTIGSTEIKPDTGDISNNILVGFTENGIQLNDTERSLISKNQLVSTALGQQNTYDGIRLNGSMHCTIDSNIVDGTGYRYGIVGLDDSSVSNVVVNNNVIATTSLGKIVFALNSRNTQFYGLNANFTGSIGSNRPSSPYLGQEFTDTTINKKIWYDGTQWRDMMGTIV